MVCYFAHSEQSLKGLRSLCVAMLILGVYTRVTSAGNHHVPTDLLLYRHQSAGPSFSNRPTGD